jgi:hypothetical protein
MKPTAYKELLYDKPNYKHNQQSRIFFSFPPIFTASRGTEEGLILLSKWYLKKNSFFVFYFLLSKTLIGQHE